jgi:hypothetical protein
MKKPDKPRFDKISGILYKFFSPSKGQYSERFKVNPRWTNKPVPAAPARAPQNTDPAIRFRNLTSRGVTSTPLQYTPASPAALSDAPQPEPDYLPSVSQPSAPAAAPAKTLGKRIFEPANALPAFWTVASAISLLVNLVLIVALILLGRELFVLKTLVGEKLIGGLYENFIFMDQAHIKTNISVADNIPINFTLPISQDVVVVLTQNTTINGANVRINTGGMAINSAANIILPAGTNLPVHLELNVPVNTTVPIQINVPVDIPLQQTELHKPFIGLQQVVAPFYNLLQPQMKGPQDVPLCERISGLCSFYFHQ